MLDAGVLGTAVVELLLLLHEWGEGDVGEVAAHGEPFGVPRAVSGALELCYSWLDSGWGWLGADFCGARARAKQVLRWAQDDKFYSRRGEAVKERGPPEARVALLVGGLRLELEAGGELGVAGLVGLGGDRTEGCVAVAGVDTAELRVVGEVVEVSGHGETEELSIGHLEGATEAEVEVVVSGSLEAVGSGAGRTLNL